MRKMSPFFSPTKGKEFLASSLPKEAFNNYVDQILPNFEFPSSGKNGILHTIFLFLRDSPMDILLPLLSGFGCSGNELATKKPPLDLTYLNTISNN